MEQVLLLIWPKYDWPQQILAQYPLALHMFLLVRPCLTHKKSFKRWKIQNAQVGEQLFGYSTCIIEVLTEMRITSEINLPLAVFDNLSSFSTFV